MSNDAKMLTPASIEFVGKAINRNTQNVTLPKFRGAAVARIHAWATGYGEHKGCSAYLNLAVNGEEIAAVDDKDFTFYSLEIERTVAIPAATETKVEMKTGNRLATEAGDPPSGFIVTVEAA